MADNKDTQTPAEFLVQLANALPRQEGADADLSAILRQHVVTDKPGGDCVAKAKAAIVRLAEQRAAPAQQEGNDG